MNLLECISQMYAKKANYGDLNTKKLVLELEFRSDEMKF